MVSDSRMDALEITLQISTLPREQQKIIVTALVDINFGAPVDKALEKMEQDLKGLDG